MNRISRVKETAKQKKNIVNALEVLIKAVKEAKEIDYSTMEITPEQKDLDMMSLTNIGKEGYISRPLTGWNTLSFKIRYRILFGQKKVKND